ncbi:MAG: D-alanyl-D-alanine carboxypeptidase, partial [Microbacterium sp.]
FIPALQSLGLHVPVLPDLLPPRRSPRRSSRRALVSLAVALVVAVGYTAATLLWPLDNVTPTVSASDAPTIAAPDADISWPADGFGAVGVEGMNATLASSDTSDTIASITKLVSVLMVLDREPLEPGEQGEAREVVYGDRVDYWNFLGRGESALDVPVGGTLTQYQLIQGALIASAGNYTEMLTRQLWPTDESFASAAAEWLEEHRLDGISIVEPTGIDRGNTADAASLIRLASIAMADPVIAEIVATESAEIPGVGTIENTNPLLGDDGVVGIKTGGLIGSYNLLAARDVPVGTTVVRVYAVALDQPTPELRGTATAELLDQVAEQVATPSTLAAGTAVATVTTPWGTEAEVVTTDDASVILWNGARVTAAADLALGASRDAGEGAGELRVEGPVDTATSALALSGDLGEPDAWWRLTHPLHLLGVLG